MATRLYFPATGAAEVSPVANGAWGDTDGATVVRLTTSKSGTAIAAGTTIAWSAGVTALDRRYVSPPMLRPGTISGTVKMQLMTREFNNGDNSTSRLEIYVVNMAGSSVVGTLLAINQYGPATEYVNNATFRNKTFADGDTLTSVAANDGDRLVVCVGHTDASGASPEAACKFGDTGTDLPENETQTTNGAGWIEFSANLRFADQIEPALQVALLSSVTPTRIVTVSSSGFKGPVVE